MGRGATRGPERDVKLFSARLLVAMEESAMDKLTRKDLNALMETSGGWCISIYTPTHRMGREVQQDPIRFKNLLDEARSCLLSKGVGAPEVWELLGPAQKLLSNGLFWQHQGDGLALFLTAGKVWQYRLPIQFEPFVLVTDRFYIKPLLPGVVENGRFYILALSQDRVSLYRGSTYSVVKIDLDQAPEGLGEALQYDDPEKQLQFHTGTRQPGGIGSRPAIFHGQGVGVDDQEADMLHYFQQVDQAVHRLLGEEHAPLVLAGVDYLLPRYRETNSYPHLLDEGIEGSPETLDEKTLHRQAWDIVRPIFLAEQREDVARYCALAGAKDQRAANKVAVVVPAAYQGRVETLFVDLDHPVWGTFDADTNVVQVHKDMESGDQDLLDYAAIQTLLKGGTVYAVDSEEMPDSETVAAVFRY